MNRRALPVLLPVLLPGLLLVLLLVLAACTASNPGAGTGETLPTPPTEGSNGATTQRRPVVAVTTSVLADVTRQVVGDTADVVQVVPTEQDPTTFVPTAVATDALGRASLIVAIGLDYEAGLADTLASARAGGTPVLTVAERLGPLPDPTDDTRLDPHVWLDPDRMTRAADLIAAEATRVGGLAPTALDGGRSHFADAMQEADEQVQARLLPLSDEQRTLVADGSTLQYFAVRYAVTFRDPGPAPSDTDALPPTDRVGDGGLPGLLVSLADAIVAVRPVTARP